MLCSNHTPKNSNLEIADLLAGTLALLLPVENHFRVTRDSGAMVPRLETVEQVGE
jgi:hypothetical protein